MEPKEYPTLEEAQAALNALHAAAFHVVQVLPNLYAWAVRLEALKKTLVPKSGTPARE